MQPGKTGRMRIKLPFEKNEVVIARFGQATLVKTGNGRTEIRGGSPCDHTVAREWISLFMHDAVPRVKPWRKHC
jgi:hypothetical protein